MTHEASPAVSVVIPNYNYGRFLEETLRSVLAQTFEDYEVFVIDDGSTDESRGIVEKIRPGFKGRLQYFYQDRRGLSESRNVGIERSRGRFISFLDADDVWLPNALKELTCALENSGAGAVYSNTEFFDDKTGAILGTNFNGSTGKLPRNGECLDALFLQGSFMPIMTTMVKRDVFEKIGLFDVSLRVGEDYDFWLRVAAHYPIGYVNRILCRVRRHGSNLTFQSLKHARAQVKILKKTLRAMPSLKNRLGEAVIHKRFYKAYLDLGRELVLADQRKRGRLYLKRALEMDPNPLMDNVLFYSFLSYLPSASWFKKKRENWHRLRARLGPPFSKGAAI